MRSRSRDARAAVLGSALLLCAACVGGGGTNTVGQTACNFNWSPGWDEEVASYERPEGLRWCPMVLQNMFTPFTGAMILDVPSSVNHFIFGTTGLAELWIKNSTDEEGEPFEDFAISEEEFIFFNTSPIADPAGPPYYMYRATATMSWLSGMSFSETLLETDSLHVSYPTSYGYQTTPQFPSPIIVAAFALTPVVISDDPGSVTGYTNVQAGSSNTWSIQTHWDTTGYKYKWYVDGVHSTADTNARISRTFTSLGNHTLRVDQFTADGDSLTSTKYIYVPINGTLSGPATANAYESYEWSLSIPYGTPPYSYAWYIDNVYVGSGSTLNHAFQQPESQHDIRVEFADSQSFANYAEIHVVVPAVSCPPEQQPCEQWLRQPGPVKRPLPKGAVRQPLVQKRP